MKVFAKITDIKAYLRKERQSGKSIGLVPTMGYLHEGHLSLIRRAASENDIVVVSIFVNPTQFGPGEDFERYPRDMERDARLAEDAGAHVLFTPDTVEMYPAGYCTYVEVEGEITSNLCGASRPGHFKGVATVVAKLFNIVSPNRSYFGQKDAQQAVVIRRMVKDLNFDTEIIVCPIVREADGLAMSSRNVYLSKEEREKAPILYKSLELARKMIDEGERDPLKIKDTIEKIITQDAGAQLDYVAVVDAETLQNVLKIENRVLIALAARFGNARLIDNILVEV